MDCNDPPPAGLLKAIAEFNRRQYFQSHETLEAVWLTEKGPIRLFYQGIIQITVGLLHVERGNHRGAVSLLGQGIEKLERFPPHCMGVGAGELARQARQARETVEALGEHRSADFPWEQAPVIQVSASPPL